ncbi:MAG TPA: hypothetical protein VKD72_04330 [Gemmataceae bacterium]|nr:hypothetical protein [Gemmataceae bacterium]
MSVIRGASSRLLGAETSAASQVHLHALLIALLQFAVEGDVLVDGQRLAAGLAGDALQFRVGQPGMADEPGG